MFDDPLDCGSKESISLRYAVKQMAMERFMIRKLGIPAIRDLGD